jgi:PAS domain S-box-containing protein
MIQPNTKLKLGLREQGLFLIALILVLELGIFLLQGFMLAEAERQDSKLEETRAVIDCCSRLGQTVYQGAEFGSRYAVTHTASYRQRFVDSVSDAEASFDFLKRVVKSPEQALKLHGIEEKFQRVITLCRRAVDLVEKAKPGTEYRAVPAGMAEDLHVTTEAMNAQLAEFVNKEREFEMQSPEAQRHIGLMLKLSLGLGIAIDAFIALLAAVLFFKRIVTKIEILVRNTQRFSAKQSLNPPLEGDDELSVLDLSFRRTFDVLKRQQDDLKAAEDRLRKILEALPVGLIILRPRDSAETIEYANPAIVKMLGYSQDEMVDKPFSFLTSQNEVSVGAGEVSLDALAKGRLLECNCYGKDGIEVPVEITAASLATPQAARTLVAIVDSRERYRLQKLRRSFVNIVTDELQLPLTSVRSFLASLQTGVWGPVSDKALDSSKRAEQNVLRLVSLINDLLDLEKVESKTIKLEIGRASLVRIVTQSIDALREFADEHKVRIVSRSMQAEVLADPGRLVQIMINLLSNAIKYSPPNSEIEISLAERAALYEISIADRGPGIPENKRDAIFERFHQVGGATQKEGSGLGLAICKAIVEEHGGTIGVDSEIGRGSRFWFTVPKAN